MFLNSSLDTAVTSILVRDDLQLSKTSSSHQSSFPLIPCLIVCSYRVFHGSIRQVLQFISSQSHQL